jgi:hypothetical protein
MVAQIARPNKCLAARSSARGRLDVVVIRGVGDHEANTPLFSEARR